MTAPPTTPPDALATRARIGILVPATNTIAAPEYEMLRPSGVTNQVVRMRAAPPGAATGNLETYRQGTDTAVPVIAEAIAMALHAAPRVILLGHSLDSFRGGVDGAHALQQRLDACANGVPVVLPAPTFLAALRSLGVAPGARIAALTPYWPPEDEEVETFFASAGYAVPRVLGLKRKGPFGISATTAAEVVDGLRALAAERPDAIVLPGTNLASLTLAAQASTWLGMPVIACNAAIYWHGLRKIGIADRIAGFGALLAEH
jgi:maleate isomerase